MSNEENKKLIKEINQEIETKKLDELKVAIRAYKQEQLEVRERLSTEKEKIEEKLRVVKLNLENLDRGNFEAIEERIKKVESARQIDPLRQVEKIIEIWHEHWPQPLPASPITWLANNGSTLSGFPADWITNATSGVFKVGDKNLIF